MNRRPAVAGSFYPADPRILHGMIEGFLAQAAPGDHTPKAIIVPHAGFQYSGAIAATAYAKLQAAADRITSVVLIGPSHRVGFHGLALSEADYFITPLGQIPIDQNAAQSLQDLPFVGYLEQAHAQEHSLEVHLPFLQMTLGEFSLTPIVAGDASPDQVSQVLERLWGGEETLIVVSSDLSHYHDYATARQLDQHTSQLIENLNYQQLTSEAACGQVPVSGLLKLLHEKALTIKTVDLRNSGDTAGDKRRVVGYGAYVVD
jgi:AmmeMemoRadiSam system protein B